jgi:nitrogen fixation protein NifU and related proteins
LDFRELDGLYREVILDHAKHPRGRKEMPDADARGEGQNPLCGDELSLALKIKDGKIADAAVSGRGCSISVASGSMLAEMAPGLAPGEALRLADAFKSMMHGEAAPEGVDTGDLDALEGVKQFPVRVKCALLAWETLRNAIKAWESGGHEAKATTENEQAER